MSLTVAAQRRLFTELSRPCGDSRLPSYIIPLCRESLWCGEGLRKNLECAYPQQNQPIEANGIAGTQPIACGIREVEADHLACYRAIERPRNPAPGDSPEAAKVRKPFQTGQEGCPRVVPLVGVASAPLQTVPAFQRKIRQKG